MSSLAAAAAALAATAAPVTLHAGERQWFVPGSLAAGAHVVCSAHGHRLTLTVPRPSTAADTGAGFFTGGGIQASIATRPNGAVEVDCDTNAAPPHHGSMPYLAGPNGLGLLRGPNTLARVRRLYGLGLAARGGGACRVAWRGIGLVATFTSCTGAATLVHASMTDARWSSLTGVRVGDSIARMLWQDQGASRLSTEIWALGGVGRTHPPRLLARVSRLGVVTELVVVER
jgi:hypothetical protein